MSKALFISGGGTKIPFLGAAASNMMNNHNVEFKYIVGVSAGAILSLPLAMGLYEEIKEMVINQDDKNIFTTSPNTLKGKLKAFKNFIQGKPNLFDDSNLEKTIKSVITKELFTKYKYDTESVNTYVVVVDIETGEEMLVNLKQHTYETAIQYVLASSAIPVYVGPRKIGDRYLYDGGMRSHIGSHLFLKKYGEKIRSCVSIYSRAENLETYKWNFPEIKPFSFSMMKVLARTIEIMNIEISKADEYKTLKMCAELGIKNTSIFAPFKLSNNPYENGKSMNMMMWKKGIEQTERNILLWK